MIKCKKTAFCKVEITIFIFLSLLFGYLKFFYILQYMRTWTIKNDVYSHELTPPQNHFNLYYDNIYFQSS